MMIAHSNNQHKVSSKVQSFHFVFYFLLLSLFYFGVVIVPVCVRVSVRVCMRSRDNRKYFNFCLTAILRLLAVTFEIPIKSKVENTDFQNQFGNVRLNISFFGKLRGKFWKREWTESVAFLFVRLSALYPLFSFAFSIYCFAFGILYIYIIEVSIQVKIPK